MAPFGKLAPQLAEVVDLAIEDNDEPAARRGHGLMAKRGKIDNRKTTVP
jgi:hypothetical protein